MRKSMGFAMILMLFAGIFFGYWIAGVPAKELILIYLLAFSVVGWIVAAVELISG